MRPNLILHVSYTAQLAESIGQAVREVIAGRPQVAVAYSGGLDSAVLAVIARRMTAVSCYTASTRDAHDWHNAPARAISDGLETRLLELSPEGIRRLAGLSARVFDTNDPSVVGYTIPLLAVLEVADDDIVMIGAGADELFAGYSKYESAENVANLMRFDLEKALSELSKLQLYAKSVHKEIAAPFASDGVIKASASVPMSHKMGPDGRKLVLRDVARSLGVRGYEKPKKAAQYSSGVAKAIRRLAKEDGRTQRAWIEKQRELATI